MGLIKFLNTAAASITGPSTTTNFIISGGSGTPFFGESTNQGLHNTTANATFSIVGSGTVVFNVAISSETNFDFGRIRRNGNLQLNVSGVGTHAGSFAVADGDSVQVQYFKDGSVNSNLDKFVINSLTTTQGAVGRLTFLGTSSVKFLATEPAPPEQTATPTVQSLTCRELGFGQFQLEAVIKNNDASTVSMQIALNSSFTSGLQTVSFTGGQTRTIIVATDTTGFTGSQSTFARATASGKTQSTTHGLTTNISFCVS